MPDVAEMVRSSGGMVWRTICRLVGRADGEVEDCFQEVFVAAMEVGRRETVRNWEGMLRRIATRKGLDLVRRRVRSKGQMEEMDVGEVVGDAEGPGVALEREELAEGLRRALAEVKPVEAEVFCLKHLEDLSYEEIGAVVGMSAGNVGVMIHRTKGRLRELMERRVGRQRSEVPHE
ncbi:MAG TPA: RNA polymerase sigma factor [Phycisphaerae bacterium]|nr:RNA polymerase sigma factor [Phycisphaerae bacterium]